MDTLTHTETVPTIGKTRGYLAAKVFAVTGALFTFGLLLSGPANATTYTDPTSGAGDSFISGLQGYFLNQVVAKALGLMVIVLSISVLVAWGRKAIKSR